MEKKNEADIKGDGSTAIVGENIKVRCVRTRVHKKKNVSIDASQTDGNASAKKKTWKDKLAIAAQSSSVAGFILNFLRALKIVP
jgi:hypothetical protein